MTDRRGFDFNTPIHYAAPPELDTIVWPMFLGFAPEATARGCSAANRRFLWPAVFPAFRCGAAVVGSLWCKPQVSDQSEIQNLEWGDVKTR